MASNQVISNPSPVSKMPRSVFHHQVPGFASMNYGRIYPVFVKYQEPRSKISMEDVRTLIRGATPIAPTMGNSSMELHAFSVPWRIVWNYTKQFFGENDSSAWTQQTLYNKPKIQLRIGDLVIAPLNFSGNTTECTAKNCSIYSEIDDGEWSISRDLFLLGRIDDGEGFFTDNDSTAWEDQVNGLGLFIDMAKSDVYGPNKLADYMGLHPIPKDADYVTLQKFWNGVVCSGNDILEVDALPFRAFFSVINYYYRDQNYQAPYLFSKDNEKLKLGISSDEANKLPMPYDFMEYRPSGNVILTNPDSQWDFYEGSAFCPPASRLHDPFSTIVPEPLKGEQYDLLSVAGLAPLTVGSSLHPTGGDIHFGNDLCNAYYSANIGLAVDKALGAVASVEDFSGAKVGSTNLYADLAKTTGITLEKFREFVVLNQWNEKAVKGTRYAEIIAEFYGGKVDPALLDEPRYLGGVSIPISSWQVTQSAPNSDGSGVGDLGAFTHTLDRSGLFTFGFEEASILIICAVSRVEHMYAQQVDPHWFREDRYDEHYPLFDGISMQPLEKKIPYLPFAFLYGEQGNPTLGFQEAYWEERFQLGNSAGVLNASNPFALRYFLYNELPTEHPTGSPEYLSAFRDAEIVDNTLQLGSQASLLAQQLLVNFSFDYYEAKQIKKSGGDPGLGRI